MKLFLALGVVLGLSAVDDPVEDFERPVLDGWDRDTSDPYPPYNTIEPVRDPASAKSGRQFLRMTTMGGSTALVRSPRRAWPVDPARPYRLSVFARLNGTRRNSASATIVWLNGDGERVAASKSAPVTRAVGWTEISIEVAKVPAGAQAASIRLEFEGDDVRGECDFDKLSFAPAVLIEIRPAARAHPLFRPDEPVLVEVQLIGAPEGSYRATGLLKFPEGRDDRRAVTLRPGEDATLDFGTLPPGAYSLEVEGGGARSSQTLLVHSQKPHERVPEIPAALRQALLRGDVLDADGRPTRWWLAQETMDDALDGAVPAADPGLFPPGVRVAAFRKADSAQLALWSDAAELDVPLSLNEGAALWPAFGPRRPLKPGERVRLGPVPVFIVGIDPLLFDLKVAISGGELPLQRNPSTRTLRFHNPYRGQTLRDVRVRLENVPDGWRVSPRSVAVASLAGGADLAEDLQFTLPSGETERDQELRFEVSFQKGGREHVTQLRRVVRLSPTVRIDAVVSDGPQPESRRVSIRVVNASDRAMTVVLRARLPFLPEQQELLRALAPGSTSAPFEYVIKDVHLIDPTHLQAELDVQESVGGRAAARKVVPLR
ncbi:MAG TPA: hypothetical protein VNM14_09355 [Planctomycetota bacterium]|nr:hypothetical protein [Planctomycetota bacterium]